MADFYYDTQGEFWQWFPTSDGYLPENAVIGGEDINGEPLFVGRAIQAGDTIPGKVVPSHGVCYVSYGGREHAHREYQVLVSNRELKWKKAKEGKVKKRAIPAGLCEDGELLFVGRAFHDNSLVIGKVHPSHGVLYFPFGGQEHHTSVYEILRYKKH
ncbi:uncharacterized protein B4U79_06805 [Dinothrombium tinctorium]|uniref:Natterin-3-like protein n=1 Tax=Dinothrombium tinctorium TaxID=1965070 RepID=A0A443R7K2_9ACAR|nr:uncharacterized protein B4U79_08657 [Dinothrombium tinctorium]RWS11237.1 uncharacterized protein B4U79_06805 [Dinothrombium tinctorium]